MELSLFDTLLLFTILLLGLLVYFKQPNTPHKTPSGTKSISQLPKPPAHFLLGNLPDMMASQTFVGSLETWAEELGDVFTVTMPLKVGPVIVSDPEIALGVLRRRPEEFRRPSGMLELAASQRLQGVFTAEGKTWQRHRKIVSPTFSPSQISRFTTPILAFLGRQTFYEWKEKASHNTILNINEEMKQFALNAIITTAFLGADDLKKDFTSQRAVTEVHEVRSRQLAHYLEVILDSMQQVIINPFYRWLYDAGLIRKPRIASAGFKALISEIVTRFQKAMADTSHADHKPPTTHHQLEPKTFLETIMRAGDLPEDELHGNIFQIFVAGHETTAITLTWFIYYLATMPEFQREIQEEVDGALGIGTEKVFETMMALPPDRASVELVEKCPLLMMALKEVLRLKSPGPIFGLESVVDTQVDGIHVPKGTRVLCLIRKMAMDPRYFPDRTKSFHPRRWENETPEQAKIANLFFGGGPRICPGRYFFYCEALVLVAMTVSQFNIRLVPGHEEVKEMFNFTMRPSDVNVHLELRCKS